MKRAYAIDQKQRYYENRIRQLKTEERLIRINGDKETASAVRRRWQELNKEYEQFSLENGRAFYRWRTRIDNSDVSSRLQAIDSKYEMLYNDNGKNFNATTLADAKKEKHIDKHIKKFTGMKDEDCENHARDFLNQTVDGDNILGFKNKNGFVFRYDKENNVFATAKPDGTIETFFKPKEGIIYWEDQIDKYGRTKN